MKLKKIVCPNKKIHDGYDTILMIYSDKKFWIHCGDRKCSHWVEIQINKKGGVKVQLMPKTVKFDVEKMPTLEVLNDDK